MPRGAAAAVATHRGQTRGTAFAIVPPMVSRPVSMFATAVLLGSALVAQVAKGSAAPAFPFQKVWNDAPESFDDLAGKVVILKFSETW